MVMSPKCMGMAAHTSGQYQGKESYDDFYSYFFFIISVYCCILYLFIFYVYNIYSYFYS